VPPEILDEGHRILHKCKDTSKYHAENLDMSFELFVRTLTTTNQKTSPESCYRYLKYQVALDK
jgi:hypothetical protein